MRVGKTYLTEVSQPPKSNAILYRSFDFPGRNTMLGAIPGQYLNAEDNEPVKSEVVICDNDNEILNVDVPNEVPKGVETSSVIETSSVDLSNVTGSITINATTVNIINPPPQTGVPSNTVQDTPAGCNDGCNEIPSTDAVPEDSETNPPIEESELEELNRAVALSEASFAEEQKRISGVRAAIRNLTNTVNSNLVASTSNSSAAHEANHRRDLGIDEVARRRQDDIVSIVRFENWLSSSEGPNEIRAMQNRGIEDYIPHVDCGVRLDGTQTKVDEMKRYVDSQKRLLGLPSPDAGVRPSSVRSNIGVMERVLQSQLPTSIPDSPSLSPSLSLPLSIEEMKEALELQKRIDEARDLKNQQDLIEKQQRGEVARSLFVDKSKLVEPVQASSSSTEPDISTECVICLNAKRCAVFKPCGHVCCCAKCADLILGTKSYMSPRCPLCRQDIKSRSKTTVFI